MLVFRRLSYSSLFFLFINCAWSTEPQLNITIDSYSEPVSIYQFTRNWNGQFKGGQHAILHGRAELFQQNTQHELALLWRYDYLVNFSEDTAEIYNAYKKELAPNVRQKYLGYLSASHTSALGIRWSPKFQPTTNLIISPGINILKGKKLTEGSVQGITQFIGTGFSGKDFGDTNVSVNYHYDHPLLHEKDINWYPPLPTGYGASLDLKVKYQPTNDSALTLNLYDVLGKIYWKDVPRTLYDFSYTPNPRSFSLAGGLSIDDQFTQKLPIRGTFEADFGTHSNWRTGFSLQADRDVWLGQVSLGYQKNKWLKKLIIEPQTQAMGISIENQYIKLRWLTDALKTDQAHRLGLDISLHLPFGKPE